MSLHDLSKYRHTPYEPGKNRLVRGLWYCANVLFFKSAWWPYYGFKRALLRCFGARIGNGVIIKPCVNIKYPWRLSIGHHAWIGENVWIDNLVEVNIGNNCCISQGALLLCGNHDYTKESFDLQVAPVVLKDGAWVGAKAVVCPGVRMGEDSILTAHSVLTRSTSPRSVWQGNPAVEKKKY